MLLASVLRRPARPSLRLLTAVLLVLAFVPFSALSPLPSPSTGHAAFPGANGKIAFDSNRDGNEEIYVMMPDGSGQTRCTSQPASDHAPAWSPDGAKIAFVSTRDGNSEIYVMNADCTNQTNRTGHLASDSQPAWSPNGAKIAFTSTRDGNSEIYIMNAGGSGQTRCTNHSAEDSTPAWSPNGAKIAFTSNRSGNLDVWVMNADCTNPVNLTTHPAADGDPNWSPDGSKIAFSSDRDNPASNEIYTMNADGTSPANCTNHSSFDDAPAWSPDGTKIVFRSNRSGNSELFVMNANCTGIPVNVTNNPAEDARPDWQPLITCTLSQTASYSGGNLTLSYTLAASVPTTWNLYLLIGNTMTSIASVPLPALNPPLTIGPLTFPFPALGNIVWVTTLTTPATGAICADLDIVATGGSPPASGAALPDIVIPTPNGLR